MVAQSASQLQRPPESPKASVDAPPMLSVRERMGAGAEETHYSQPQWRHLL